MKKKKRRETVKRREDEADIYRGSGSGGARQKGRLAVLS